MKQLIISAALVLATSFAAMSTANAADATMHVDGALVQKTGSGPAVILIPGLGGGPFVYANVIPELSKRATVYAVTLPGYDGVPAVSAPYLPAFEKSITDLIAQEHLVRPLIVGHSLGGHLAVKLAEDIPNALGAVMAIDAVPLYPYPQPGQTTASRAATVAKFDAALTALPDDTYVEQSKQINGYLTTGDANVAAVNEHALKSDKPTEIHSGTEMMLEDLGPKLATISVPVVVLAAVPPGNDTTDVVNQYKALYAGTPHLSVVPIAPSKHFIMLDQPDAFRAALDAFVNANVAKKP